MAPDDAPVIISKIQAADVVAFATPIYFYEMSGQLKTLLDRTVSIYSAPYKFRDIYLLATAAEDEAPTPNRAFQGLGGWVECFEQARVAGQVFAGGVYEQNTIVGHPALEAARQMGSQV
ncbi:MAG: flavodoxin family protein [Akkermansia sp.]|nr:flavodoxin family protein [Akkermansia sp.]